MKEEAEDDADERGGCDRDATGMFARAAARMAGTGGDASEDASGGGAMGSLGSLG